MNLKSFENAFSDKCGSYCVECACGKEYYTNDGGSLAFGEGELEALLANENAIELSWSPGYLSFEGQTFALDCTCWHARAHRIMNFLDGHAVKIAAYFSEEKKRLQDEAAALPTL